ncbi:hypothetical protein MAPG_03246 [Magnaporthiopsis poae ATCC 64411]|uniref:Uncharacterized protein n=1 Tax=Magnaporthiopsis poae (strain ATCC 64411 / 73-15) TaxID=644358 RepID=A0A0C4DTH8_MAGP6|nr:hypothetical protein MAPG_03246 [Magnaporthiopsis poae ATCC 64411]
MDPAAAGNGREVADRLLPQIRVGLEAPPYRQDIYLSIGLCSSVPGPRANWLGNTQYQKGAVLAGMASRASPADDGARPGLWNHSISYDDMGSQRDMELQAEWGSRYPSAILPQSGIQRRATPP